jgi:glycosyltransferase involved in cell wall biosynthesis
MRIALCSHLASPQAPTGAERSLALLAAGLARRGHEVGVIAPGAWVLAEELRSSGVRLLTVPSHPCWLSYWEPRRWPVVAWKALRCVLSRRAISRLHAALVSLAPDVVLVNCLPNLSAAEAARRTGRPWLWHVREILPPGARRRWWAGRMARSGASFVAVSEAVRTWIHAEQPGLHVRVVYNGVPLPAAIDSPALARPRLGLPATGVWAGYLGQLAPHKGVQVLLEAAAIAMRQHPELCLLLAGPGSNREQRAVREQASLLPAQRCVVMEPRLSTAELIAACDVLCVPTLTPDPAPRAVIEGMAAGRVVIGAPTGGIPELIEDGITGLLLQAVAPSLLAAALLAVTIDAPLRQRLGEAARASAATRFDLDHHVETMEALLLAPQ